MNIPGPQDIQADLQRAINIASNIDVYYEKLIKGNTRRTAYGERMILHDAEYLRALANGIVAGVTARYEEYKYNCEPANR